MTGKQTKWMVVRTGVVALAMSLIVAVFVVTRPVPAPAPAEKLAQIQRFGAILDPATIPTSGDASGVLQALLDTGAAIELPPRRITLSRPVYLSSGCEVRGVGNKSEVYAPDRDAFLACPPTQRNYDPAPHFVANALDANRWAFRSRGLAGIRFQNTRADSGWTGADNWRAVRQFAVEMVVTRHDTTGVIAGLAWHKKDAEYHASPWLVTQRTDWPGYTSFHITTADDVTHEYRFHAAVFNATTKLVFKVNLDAGTVVFEQDDIEIGDVFLVNGAIMPGATLHENRGAPLWLGGGNHQAGGACPPELGKSDVTFHAFRVWRTATPPASGYNPHGWQQNTVMVLPYTEADKPKIGDPAVGFTGEQTAFGYLVPFSPNDWCNGVRVEGVTFVGEEYGTGLAINSALDVNVNRCRFIKARVGLQIMGGPLPCYPVRIRDLFGDHNTDCLARVQRTIVREFDNITAKYPRRSVARFDDCGFVSIRDLFHAGENAGPVNTVGWCLHLSNCGVVSVDGWLSNYEDGINGGPRFGYLRATGNHPEPNQVQLLRVRDFAKQSLRPGAKYIDDAGLAASCVRQISDSFDVTPIPVP